MKKIDIEKFDSNSNGIQDIAIAIKLIDASSRQSHLGLFLKPDGIESPKLLHLAWHNDFRYDEIIDDGYFCLSTCKNVEKAVVESFVDWLDSLWDINGKDIAYSLFFNTNEDAFDEQGHLVGTDSNQGFTCSTFVLECFKCYGFQLISYETWPQREDDKKWLDKICYILEHHTRNVDPEHIQKHKAMTDIIRYRPEEVALAANMHEFDSTPLKFCDIEPYSDELVRMIS
ncbi:hypothetical protein [Citrobacter farmeri]|uniref:hypothetical protein n=1 Tax=Citrobacter farmeri TaxID=67824 RepID=UPI0018983E1B|nr:hypothetical protein [Citrobacter farmeri]MDB2171184.1 hypothetical protein [Citrobacter farmeri]